MRNSRGVDTLNPHEIALIDRLRRGQGIGKGIGETEVVSANDGAETFRKLETDGFGVFARKTSTIRTCPRSPTSSEEHRRLLSWADSPTWLHPACMFVSTVELPPGSKAEGLVGGTLDEGKKWR